MSSVRTVGFRPKKRARKAAPGVRATVLRVLANTAETKWLEGSLPGAFASVGSNWVEAFIANPPGGGFQGQQIGANFRIKSLDIYGVIAQGSNGTAADDAYNIFRVFVGVWGQGTNSVAPFGNMAVAQRPTLNTPIIVGNNCSLNLEKVLDDQIIALPSNGVERAAGDGYCPALRTYKFHHKFPGTGLQVRIREGSTYDTRIWMSCLSDSLVITNPGFVQGWYRVEYTDI